jgi:hypothetical protein
MRNLALNGAILPGNEEIVGSLLRFRPTTSGDSTPRDRSAFVSQVDPRAAPSCAS